MSALTPTRRASSRMLSPAPRRAFPSASAFDHEGAGSGGRPATRRVPRCHPDRFADRHFTAAYRPAAPARAHLSGTSRVRRSKAVSADRQRADRNRPWPVVARPVARSARPAPRHLAGRSDRVVVASSDVQRAAQAPGPGRPRAPGSSALARAAAARRPVSRRGRRGAPCSGRRCCRRSSPSPSHRAR